MDFVPTTLKPSEALTVRLLFLPSNVGGASQSSAELAVTTSQVRILYYTISITLSLQSLL